MRLLADVILNVFDILDFPSSPNDSFVLFEPTSPIRFQSDLQNVVRLITDTNRVVSISEAKVLILFINIIFQKLLILYHLSHLIWPCEASRNVEYFLS